MSDEIKRHPTPPSPVAAHWICVATLIAVSILLRLPSMDRVALNPDESQLEATASYMIETGTSPFELPYIIQASLTVYKGLAVVFGPYATLPLRLLVLAVATVMALLIYGVLRREAGPWTGLLGGLIFLHLNIHFEGLSANREWFSTLALMLSTVWTLRALRASAPRAVSLFGAGAAAAFAVTFKSQAAPLVLAVPALLALQALHHREPRRLGRDVAAFGGGGLSAAALYLAPFLFHGTLGLYLDQVGTFLFGYTAGGHATDPGPGSHLASLYLDLPFRPLFLVAYLVAFLVILSSLVRPRLPRFPWVLSVPALQLQSLMLVFSLVAVQLGGRFFPHYYLFIVPWVAILCAAAAHPLRKPTGSNAGLARMGGWLLAVALAVDGLWFLARMPYRRWLELWPSSSLSISFGVVFLGLMVFWLLAPRQRLSLVLSGWILLQVALLLAQTQKSLAPNSLPYHPGGFAALSAEIDRLDSDDDRLFVWGWLPELYSLTRLPAASHLSICQYVVGDYTPRPAPPALREPFAAMLMRDLEHRPPRFIVDASRRSWTMVEHNDPRLYSLRLYPELGLTDALERDYRLQGRFDGCDLYVRR